MSELFHIIPNAFVILHAKGVYRQAALYEYDNHIYAKYGNGFIQLSKNGTSVSNVSIKTFPYDKAYDTDKFGRYIFVQ